MPPTASLPQSFLAKKARILSQLSIPSSEYNDHSPKGSIDFGIRDLIDEINALEGCVTTSSCAGRVSVFLEGRKITGDVVGGGGGGEEGDVNRNDESERGQSTGKAAGVGGKGGGRWLFVSHDPVESKEQEVVWSRMLGMQREDCGNGDALMTGDVRTMRFIHFKFEPMVRCRGMISSPLTLARSFIS